MPALPYNDTAVVDQPWNGPGQEAALANDAGQAAFRAMYAWVDSNGDSATKAAYKLPHHQVANGKPGAANVNGVRAALARLNQSATQIPAGDKNAVRAHLQKHLDKWNSSNPGDQEQPGKSDPDDKSGLVIGDAILVQTAGRKWAVRSEVLEELIERGAGLVASEDFAVLAARQSSVTNANGVAVIPLKGMITPQASFLSLLFGGGGGLQSFSSNLASAVADREVKAIVFDVDSPGGLVDQVPEVARQIREARDVKPVVAVANTLAASAAYWLASQANEVVVTDSGEVGAIGVYQVHTDRSGLNARMGIKPTLISAGKYKVEGNPHEPLNEDAHAAIKQSVDDFYDMFTADVAAGRSVSQDEVKNGYGEGRTMGAQRAKRAGLADRVATLGQTVSRLSSGRARVRRTEAEDFPTRGELEDGHDSANQAHVYTPEERDRLVGVLARLR